MVVALDGTEADPKLHLFLSLDEAKEQYPGRHDDAFFPVLTCRSCGQHFFEKCVHRPGVRPRGQEPTQGLRERQRRTERRRPGQRLLVPVARGNRHPAGPDQPASGRGGRRALGTIGTWPRAWFCRQCGAMHREPSPRCLADGCGHKEPLLPLIAFGSGLSACPSCSTPSFRIGGRDDRTGPQGPGGHGLRRSHPRPGDDQRRPGGPQEAHHLRRQPPGRRLPGGLDAGPRPPHPAAAHDASGDRRGRHRRCRSTPSPTS